MAASVSSRLVEFELFICCGSSDWESMSVIVRIVCTDNLLYADLVKDNSTVFGASADHGSIMDDCLPV